MIVTEKPVQVLRQFLYVEPMSACNLHCKMCYANVINGADKRVLDGDRLLAFVRNFLADTPPPVTVYWSGTGEVFLHRDFPRLVNQVLREFPEGVAQIIQTNGTVKRLAEFDSLERLDFQVSIDGGREYHEWHRGQNTYDRTVNFCRECVDRGCKSLTVRTLLTRDNIDHLDEFYEELRQRISPDVNVSLMIPFTNRRLRAAARLSLAIVQKDVEDDRALPEEDARAILQERYQGRYTLEEDSETVNNYLSLNTYGVHTCCNGIIKIGEMDTNMGELKARMAASEPECVACALFPCM